jgi:ABC-type branched-subunit amino acid transport system substrate-binding protein
VRVTIRALAAVAVCTVLAAGCSRAGGSSSTTTSTSTSTATSSAAGATGGTFGSVSDACHGGSASGSPDQGVTSSAITVGVLTDESYTKDPELVNAANVFTDWCNAAGGINGRKLVADIHQTDLMAVTTAVTAACSKDFVLAGGSAALDGLAVTNRLKCLLPDYDAQPVMAQNSGSGIQLRPYNSNFVYSNFAGFYKFALQKYPDSAQHVGILSGSSIITTVDSAADADTVKALGGTVAYNSTFPLTGTVNWTPYAEAIKSKGIKGLTFYDTPQTLIALEQALDNIGYKLDWINANTNAYDTSFIQQAGNTLTEQTNYAPLPGIYPLEDAKNNPATEQLTQLFAKYAPGQPITLQILQAWSMWLLFAESAETCGSNLTRACAYDAAVKESAWTGGGITAPVNEATPLAPANCFNVEQATASGWKAADFGANTGPYLCGGATVKLPSGFPAATQLSDVGLSLSDLK